MLRSTLIAIVAVALVAGTASAAATLTYSTAGTLTTVTAADGATQLWEMDIDTNTTGKGGSIYAFRDLSGASDPTFSYAHSYVTQDPGLFYRTGVVTLDSTANSPLLASVVEGAGAMTYTVSRTVAQATTGGTSVLTSDFTISAPTVAGAGHSTNITIVETASFDALWEGANGQARTQPTVYLYSDELGLNDEWTGTAYNGYPDSLNYQQCVATVTAADARMAAGSTFTLTNTWTTADTAYDTASVGYGAHGDDFYALKANIGITGAYTGNPGAAGDARSYSSTTELDIAIVAGASRVWDVDAGGNWADAGNWAGGPPPAGNTGEAHFTAAITGSATVYTDADVTVKVIEFDNASSYNISGNGSVNLEADTGNASINVVQGDHQFQAEVNLVVDVDVDIAAGASLTFNNKLDQGGNAMTVTGTGTLNINNTLVVTVSGAASSSTIVTAGSLDLGGGGALEVTEAYTPGATDSWVILTATGGITGSFGSVTDGYEVALANGDTELVLSLVSALTPGDANGDGSVDLQDFGLLKANFGTTGGATWAMGDFNGDGNVDLQDFGLLKANFGTGGAAVPEPATLSLIAIAGIGLLRRKRK